MTVRATAQPVMVKGYDIKNVELSPTRWATLCDHIEEVNIAARAVQEGAGGIKLRLHLGVGGAYYISVTCIWVQICRHTQVL